MVPSDRTLVVERFRDEIGDWRLCVLSPVRRTRPRARGRWRSRRASATRFGLEADAIWSDDGIIVHLPDADEPPGAELVLVDPEEAEDLVVAELGASALFGARFRENAGPLAAHPARLPGPPHAALAAAPQGAVAARGGAALPAVPRHPRDLPRVPARRARRARAPGAAARDQHPRDRLVEVETQTASPFASSLLFDYVATYMYEGDTPAAERRAVALSLDRELLRELLGQEELRDLIDPGALEQVEDDLQHCSEQLRARTPTRCTRCCGASAT